MDTKRETSSSPDEEQAQNFIPTVEMKQEVGSSPDHKRIQDDSPKIQVKQDPEASFDGALSSITTALPTQPSLLTKSTEFSLAHVRSVAESENLAILEAGESVARAILCDLEAPLADANEQRFLDDIKKFMDKPKAARTIVAVAGATGAGRSSLINAALGEKLLPTNGMRGENAPSFACLDFPDENRLPKNDYQLVPPLSPKSRKMTTKT